MCHLYTDDGRLETIELPVLQGSVLDEEKGKGFVLDATNQYFNKEDGQWYQVLWERSSIPLCMINQSSVKDLTALIDQIFHQNRQKAEIKQFKRANKNALLDRIIWLVAIPCVTILLIFAANYFGGR